MIKKLNLMTCLIFLLVSPSNLLAETITIEVRTVATGSLGTANFTNAMVTITGVGDTANVVANGSVNLLLEGIEVSVDVEGVGSAVFTDAVQAISNNNSELGGFGNTSNSFGLITVFNPAFSEYDLLTDLEPVSGFGVIVIGIPHQTTAGSLRLFSVLGDNATYTASVTPDCPFALGDMNEDGNVNLLDVNGFVSALGNGRFICQGDFNKDGSFDLLDVDGFVNVLSGP